MKTYITAEQLIEICAPTKMTNAPIVANSINKKLNQYNDDFFKVYDGVVKNDHKRVAMFIAQLVHESAYFSRTSENLTYSNPDILLKVFGKYITKETVNGYLKNSSKLANLVYANRYGNGSVASGDGYKYRGRGYIQLTFKDNYIAYSNARGITLDDGITFLGTVDGAVDSAIWFFDTRKCNKFADIGDILGQTKVINGGTNGLDHRTVLYTKALRVTEKNFK